jgi:hypothetical protein
MNVAAAVVRPPEFGTGLRAHIERASGLAGRRACPSSRDLVLLCTDEPSERRASEPGLAARDRAVRGARGAFAA